MPDNTVITDPTDENAIAAARTTQKWGGLAAFLLAGAFMIAPYIYLVGNLRDTFGPLGYSIADVLYGPVWAASLVTLVFALREHIGTGASRRMSLALLAAALAAGAMVCVALIRASNRHYHLVHPELHLETSTTVLVVWTTLIAGMSNAGWHFLGWGFVLIGSAGWTSGRIPRLLSGLYLAAGAVALFVYLLPESEGIVILLGVVVSIWQGILLLRARPQETPAIEPA
jgi:hypothetical protein